MAVISVRINEEETKLLKSYCKIHGISMSEAYKQALLEKIEDEFDAEEMIKETEKFNKNPQTHSLEEVRKVYNL